VVLVDEVVLVDVVVLDVETAVGVVVGLTSESLDEDELDEDEPDSP